MGNFAGHALPGTFFIIFGLWWTVCQFMRFYKSRVKNSQPYHNTATFRFLCLCGRLKTWEMEGFLKIFFTSVGFMLEIITGTRNGQFVYLGNGQHATMFFFFGMTGVVDLLLHHRVPLPKSLNYISMMLALTVEGVLFKFHLHGRADLDVVLHTLLVYVIVMNTIAVGLELKFQDSVISGLARSYFVLVQGTWFWQVGFILYNPLPGAQPWDQEDHEQIMIATMIFAWHLGAVFIIQMLICGVVACMYRCRGEYTVDHQHPSVNYDRLSMGLLRKPGANGHSVHVKLEEEDTDSDIEFQRPHTQIPAQ